MALNLNGCTLESPKAAVPNLFGTGDQFWGRHFSHGPGWGVGGETAQAVMRVTESSR